MNTKYQLLLILLFHLAFPAIAQPTPNDDLVKSIELRNYTLLPGTCAKFSSYMDRIIIPKQRELGGYLLNAFSLNDADDHYFWMRGFADMPSRSKFMKDFYYSDYWKKNAAECNSMLIDSYDVHLLKPLQIKDHEIDSTRGISIENFTQPTGITVITYYTTSNARQQLIDLFANDYLPILTEAGINPVTFLISESVVNDYLPQHVYQDKNLLVMITHFKDEQEYRACLKDAIVLTNTSMHIKLAELLMSVSTQILHPLKH